jgi:centromeric protein E
MLGNERSPGILLLAVSDLFHHIYTSPQREFMLKASYLEIYNEVLCSISQIDPLF